MGSWCAMYIFSGKHRFFSSEILATSLLHRLLLHPRDHVNSRLGRGLGGPENEPLLGLASCRYLEITSCTYSFMGLAIKIRGMNQLTWWFYHFFRGQLGVNSTECNHKAGPKPIFAGFVVDIPWYTSNILEWSSFSRIKHRKTLVLEATFLQAGNGCVCRWGYGYKWPSDGYPYHYIRKAKTTSFPVFMSHFTSFYHPAFFLCLEDSYLILSRNSPLFTNPACNSLQLVQTIYSETRTKASPKWTVQGRHSSGCSYIMCFFTIS